MTIYRVTVSLRYNLDMQIDNPVPDFELPDLNGKIHKLSEYRGKIIIVNFWSAECAYSVRTDGLMSRWLARWGSEVVLLSIAMNRNESARSVEEAAGARGIPTVLLDAGLIVTDQYGVEITPHVHVIDRKGILRYRGAVDDVTFRQKTATRFFVEEAVDALLEGRAPELTETPAYGCAIVREI
jgi:peroxiredoxin